MHFTLTVLALVAAVFLRADGAKIDAKRRVRRDTDAGTREKLVFTLRALDAGMDISKQTELDKREFEVRNLVRCSPSDCAQPSALPTGCTNGFTPVFANPQNAASGKCSCVASYDCCPATCSQPTDPCVKGTNYAVTRDNCCGCPTTFCLPCPAVVKKCPNKCDVAEDDKDERGCPTFKCVRPPPGSALAPQTTKPVCNSKCQVVKTKTDECGYHSQHCECLNPPQCTPTKPADKACHKTQQIMFPTWGCAAGSNDGTCVQCYYWRHEPIPPVSNIDESRCKKCEIAKVRPTSCGGYETECQCRKYNDCHPAEPEELSCHTKVKVFSTDTFVCDASSSDGCSPCYTWKYERTQNTKSTATCDSNCMYKRPVSQDCGSGEECVCNGKDAKYCQPDEPARTACYTPRKVMTIGSYMCNSAQDACVQCWTWKFEKNKCADIPLDKRSCSTCQTLRESRTECGCKKIECLPIERPECEPVRPAPDSCHEAPVIEYTGVQSHKIGGCASCYRWIVNRKPIQNSDVCDLKHLPANCYHSYETPGTCGEVVTKCQKSGGVCSEEYKTRACAAGKTMVTLYSQCDQDRDACVDCSNIVTQSPSKTLPDSCYEDHTLIIMGQCKHTIPVKKSCPMPDDLRCEDNGLRKKLFYDVCGCPVLKCVGCPVGNQVDIQLVLDSSGSIGQKNWVTLITKIKQELIGDLMTNTQSRMAIARYGDDVNILAPLSTSTRGETLNPYLTYTGMGASFLAHALRTLLPDYKTSTATSPAKKVLVVITDGTPNDANELDAATKQWADTVDEIYALGYGNVNLEGLEAIKPKNHDGLVLYELELEKLEDEIMKQVVPKVCNGPTVVLN